MRSADKAVYNRHRLVSYSLQFKEYTPLLLAIKACSSVEIVRTILNEDLTALQVRAGGVACVYRSTHTVIPLISLL